MVWAKPGPHRGVEPGLPSERGKQVIKKVGVSLGEAGAPLLPWGSETRGWGQIGGPWPGPEAGELGEGLGGAAPASNLLPLWGPPSVCSPPSSQHCLFKSASLVVVSHLLKILLSVQSSQVKGQNPCLLALPRSPGDPEASRDPAPSWCLGLPKRHQARCPTGSLYVLLPLPGTCAPPLCG